MTDERETRQYDALVEALIFASPDPVPALRIAEIIGEIKTTDVEDIIAGLNEKFELDGHSIHIVRAAGGFRFATRKAYSKWVKQLLTGSGRVRLSRAALESLSVIAYKQPVSKAEIEEVRRVDATGVLKLLLERKLIKITGRSKSAGRPLLYGTTTEFLKHFGLDSLDDLPQMAEMAEKGRRGVEQPELFEAE